MFFLLFLYFLVINIYAFDVNRSKDPFSVLGLDKLGNGEIGDIEGLLLGGGSEGKNPFSVLKKEFKFDKEMFMKKIDIKKFEISHKIVKEGGKPSNITLPQIPSEAITATVNIAIHNPLFTYTVDQIIFIEYQNETKTEIRVSHELVSAVLSKIEKEEGLGLSLYEGGIDMGISNDAPCKKENLGEVVELPWLEDFVNMSTVEGNGTRFFVNSSLLTGSNSLIGKTFFANVMILGPMCGTILLNDTVKSNYTHQEPIIYGATLGRNFDGLVKITQYPSSNLTTTQLEYYVSSPECDQKMKNELDTASNMTNFSLSGIGIISERALYPCENELLSGENVTGSQDGISVKSLGMSEESNQKMEEVDVCSKKYVILNDFIELMGENATLQLTISKNHSQECVQLEKWQEFSFRYLVYTFQDYEDIKEDLARKVAAHPYQVSIAYSRELVEDICSILNVTFVGTLPQVEELQQTFNLTDYKFNDAISLNCTSSDHINNMFALRSLKKYLALIAIPLMILMFGALLLAATTAA